MHKWIQHAEKPLKHLDYMNLATQICRFNYFSPDFGQNQMEKSQENCQKIKRLYYYLSERQRIKMFLNMRYIT
jgi:hypothetical protein